MTLVNHKMKKVYLSICALFLVWGLSSTVFANDADTPVKDVKVGMFLTNLYDIDLNKNQFNVQFWAWFVHGDKTYEPTKRTELMNAKSWTTQNEFRGEVGDQYWDVVNVRAKIYQEWDVSHYPFDKQKLVIELEDIEETTGGVRFTPDVEGSKIDKGLIPDGWKMLGFDVSVAPNQYDTVFGDPSLGNQSHSEFSRITATLTVQRDGWRLFATNFIGFFVATILILLTLGINSSRRAHKTVPLQPRVTMSSGSIFATIGSIYMLSKELPYTTKFTLADGLLTTTCIGIGLAIIMSVLTDTLTSAEFKKSPYLINKIIFALFVFVHIGLNGYYLMNL